MKDERQKALKALEIIADITANTTSCLEAIAYFLENDEITDQKKAAKDIRKYVQKHLKIVKHINTLSSHLKKGMMLPTVRK